MTQYVHSFDENGIYLSSSEMPFGASGINTEVATGKELPVFDVSTQYLQWNGNDWLIKEIEKPIIEEPTPIEPIKPSMCTPTQGLISLFVNKQITEDILTNLIDNIENLEDRYKAQIAFKRATYWEKNSPTMQLMANLLNLSTEDLDTLFEYAVTVNV